MIHLNLTPEQEAYLKAKVSTGQFASVTEVVRTAIREMQQADEQIGALRAALQVGIDQADAGQGVPWTREASRELLERARRKASPIIAAESAHEQAASPRRARRP